MPPKTEKKTKVKKEGPKKNKSAYMFFCADARKEINKEQEGKDDKMDNKEIIREQGRRWTDVKEDEKRLEYYQKLAAEDKKRYEKEKEAFGPVENKTKKTEKVDKEEKKSTKKKAEPKKTKKAKEPEPEIEEDEDGESESVASASEDEEEAPKVEETKKTRVNGYVNYTKEMRDKVKKSNPKLAPKEVTAELSKQWKALSETEKEKYKNK